MIIIWRADYDGDDLDADLKKLDQIHSNIIEKVGGKIDGPYLPQEGALLYIFHVDKYEWLNQAGRLWLAEVEKAKIPITPLRYEVAVTPREFFG